MKARTLLKKLVDYGLLVRLVHDNIRLSPRHLINDKVLNFVRTHKNDLMCALHEEHKERKANLGPRVYILENLIYRFLRDEGCRDMVNYRGDLPITKKAMEAYLDSELINFDYDLEAAIAMYRHYTPEGNASPSQCLRCGYNSLFCLCKG